MVVYETMQKIDPIFLPKKLGKVKKQFGKNNLKKSWILEILNSGKTAYQKFVENYTFWKTRFSPQ